MAAGDNPALAAYDQYVQQQNGKILGTRGHSKEKVLPFSEWSKLPDVQKRFQVMSDGSVTLAPTSTPGAPGAAPNPQAEAQARAATMPGAGGSGGLLGFDGTTDLKGAPTGYTPYLTTTSGGVAQGKSPGYAPGMEYSEWQDKGEQDRVEWKQALYFAGMYGNQKPVLNGDLAPEDIAAMKQAMVLGNLNGKEWRDAIAPRVEMGQQQGGAFTGQGGGSSAASGAFDQTVTQLRDFAKNNGIDLTEDFIGKQAKAIAAGTVSSDEVFGNLRDKFVARAYPGMAEDIRAGHDVSTLAAPYVASMSKLLEIPEGDVNLKDPTIAKALQAVDDKGKPATVPLWQFEQEVKKDSRYQYTQNAWNDIGHQAYQMMQSFGLQG